MAEHIDQTATDHANRDVQIRSFPSNVSVVSANNGLLYIENLNSQPLAPFGLIIGVQADVNFSSDGFAYATAISWKRDYEIDGMGPCSQYSLDMSGNPGVADYSGLIFVDNDGLIWYRESGGLLVQVLLEPAQQISLPARFLRAPKYSSASYKGYKTFAGCS